MKYNLSLLTMALLLGHVALAQDSTFSLPTKNGAIFYQQVISVDSVPKSELFDRGRMWAVDYFNSAKDVIQIADKDAGQLTGKGIFVLANTKYSLGYQSSVKFTFNIQYKDEKYRVQFYDFIITSVSPINGQSVTDPMDSVYYHFINHQEHKALFESKKNAVRRYAGYLYSFVGQVDVAEKSLYSYENGQHKTDF
jgi:hypothetical protein